MNSLSNRILSALWLQPMSAKDLSLCLTCNYETARRLLHALRRDDRIEVCGRNGVGAYLYGHRFYRYPEDLRG